MEQPRELDRIYLHQLSLLTNTKRMYKYLVNHNMLDRESDRLFRDLLKKGKTDLWKSFLCLKKLYRNEEKYKMYRRRIIRRTNIEQ